MNTGSNIILEPYKPGGSTKETCPKCGRRKCFTHYVFRDTGERVGKGCGICDHRNSCGYHCPPREFFREHPVDPEWQKNSATYVRLPEDKLPPELCLLPHDVVAKSHRPSSQFVQWLFHVFADTDAVIRAFNDYRLGATKDGGVIFWQIDAADGVRTGKVMHYASDGHRTGITTWVHSLMITQRKVSERWHLTQCLFGEHLLPWRKSDTVCLVESEKTAVVCSIVYPQYVWLATGGCGALNPQKASALKGRRVIVFPDSGELQHWRSIMAKTVGIDYSFVEALESYPKNTDIADIILTQPP